MSNYEARTSSMKPVTGASSLHTGQTLAHLDLGQVIAVDGASFSVPKGYVPHRRANPIPQQYHPSNCRSGGARKLHSMDRRASRPPHPSTSLRWLVPLPHLPSKGLIPERAWRPVAPLPHCGRLDLSNKVLCSKRISRTLVSLWNRGRLHEIVARCLTR